MNKRSEIWHQELVNKVLSKPEGLAEYKAFKAQLELADRLKAARQKAHITQEMVAERMDTKKSADT